MGPGPHPPKTEVPCALTPFPNRTLPFKRLLTMAACGAEIIVIVPLVVGPISDEGLVSWQGTPLTGLGGGMESLVTSLAAVERMGPFEFFSFFSRLLRRWLTDR